MRQQTTKQAHYDSTQEFRRCSFHRKKDALTEYAIFNTFVGWYSVCKKCNKWYEVRPPLAAPNLAGKRVAFYPNLKPKGFGPADPPKGGLGFGPRKK